MQKANWFCEFSKTKHVQWISFLKALRGCYTGGIYYSICAGIKYENCKTLDYVLSSISSKHRFNVELVSASISPGGCYHCNIPICLEGQVWHCNYWAWTISQIVIDGTTLGLIQWKCRKLGSLSWIVHIVIRKSYGWCCKYCLITSLYMRIEYLLIEAISTRIGLQIESVSPTCISACSIRFSRYFLICGI